MSYVVTDSSAPNIYSTMYKYYGGRNMPEGNAGVFFGFANYDKDKLIYTIEFLKGQYGLGWFTDDFETRSNAINRIVNGLYTAFNQSVSKDGIKKFCNWVYAWAKTDKDAVSYFSGESSYTFLDAMFKDVSETIGNKVSNVVETVSYGVNYPSLEKLTPTSGTLIKWGVIAAGGLFAVNYLSKKLF